MKNSPVAVVRRLTVETRTLHFVKNIMS